MKKRDSAKILAILLCISLIILIFILALFLIYIYKDYKLKNDEKNNIIEISGQISMISLNSNDDDNEEIEPIYIELPDIELQETEEILEDNNINKFYYNQLDEYSKLIYEAIYNEKDNLINGTQIISIPNNLGELLKLSDGENRVQGVFTNALNAFEYDNPELFYIDLSKMVLYYEGNLNNKFRIYIKNDNETKNYFIDGIDSEETANIAKTEVDIVIQNIKKDIEELNLNTEYKKIKFIHDWIVNNIEYDTTLNRSNRNNIYGLFVEKQATCGGYAKAFKYLVDELGIECIVIQGEANSNEKIENHAWNYIKINDKWYGVDCTWDDPIIIGDIEQGVTTIYYTYFLKGKNVFENTHHPIESLIGTKNEFYYPELEFDNYSTSNN